MYAVQKTNAALPPRRGGKLRLVHPAHAGVYQRVRVLLGVGTGTLAGVFRRRSYGISPMNIVLCRVAVYGLHPALILALAAYGIFRVVH